MSETRIQCEHLIWCSLYKLEDRKEVVPTKENGVSLTKRVVSGTSLFVYFLSTPLICLSESVIYILRERHREIVLASHQALFVVDMSSTFHLGCEVDSSSREDKWPLNEPNRRTII